MDEILFQAAVLQQLNDALCYCASTKSWRWSWRRNELYASRMDSWLQSVFGSITIVFVDAFTNRSVSLTEVIHSSLTLSGLSSHAFWIAFHRASASEQMDTHLTTSHKCSLTLRSNDRADNFVAVFYETLTTLDALCCSTYHSVATLSTYGSLMAPHRWKTYPLMLELVHGAINSINHPETHPTIIIGSLSCLRKGEKDQKPIFIVLLSLYGKAVITPSISK